MKNYFSLLVILMTAQSLHAQTTSLPIVYAEGGEGKNKVYKKLTNQERDNMPGYVWSVCSNCIGMSDCNMKASSTLSSQGAVNYSTKNMQDDDPTTAWVEGDIEYGIGEYIEIKDAGLASSLIICNGYQKSPKSFIENSRVKDLRVSVNGKDRCIVRLKDEMGTQFIGVEKLGLKNGLGDNSVLRFTIMEVYPGIKFKDVAISEMFTNGCCISGQSKIILSDDNKKEIQDVTMTDSVMLIDNSNHIFYAFNVEFGSILHNIVLEITTANGNQIVVTPNHYLYTDSRNHKIQARQLKVNDPLQMINNNNEIVTDKITKISQMDTPVKTYYFKKMQFGDQKINWPVRAIFNNIITDDEYLDKINQLKTRR